MSDIRANTISNTSGNGPINLTGQSAAKVWCTVHRGTSPIEFFDKFGVSSLDDEGTGEYRVHFATDFKTTRYACSGCAYTTTGNFVGVSGETSGSVLLNVFASDGSYANIDCSLIIHGDLA